MDIEQRNGFPYEDLKAYSSQENRDLHCRTVIVDFILQKKQSDINKEILAINIIDAALNCFEKSHPVYSNIAWVDKRLHTPFNTLSHFVGTYSDDLWVKLDSIREEMNLI